MVARKSLGQECLYEFESRPEHNNYFQLIDFHVVEILLLSFCTTFAQLIPENDHTG